MEALQGVFIQASEVIALEMSVEIVEYCGRDGMNKPHVLAVWLPASDTALQSALCRRYWPARRWMSETRLCFEIVSELIGG